MSTGPRNTEIDERYYVDAAARTLQLLKVVAALDGPVSLSTLVTRLGWSKPAVYRLVRTLEAVGGLRLHDGKGYVLGPALITLGQAALRATRLLDVGRPHLEALYQQLDETIVLTVLDGDEIVYVDRVEADKILIPRTRLGSRLPAYATSTGQVLLSGLDDDDVRRRLRDRAFEPLAPNTLRDVDELIERLAEIRRRGYAINDEELAVGHRSVAAPVRDHSGGVVAAVSVSVPSARVSRGQLAEFATGALLPACEAISVGLGATPAPGA
jgi:IclR family transcriptional regulator, pca regulon regulatory protein